MNLFEFIKFIVFKMESIIVIVKKLLNILLMSEDSYFYQWRTESQIRETLIIFSKTETPYSCLLPESRI